MWLIGDLGPGWKSRFLAGKKVRDERAQKELCVTTEGFRYFIAGFAMSVELKR